MQAVILAAGMGKRLGRYTKDATKCMVSVNGKTLIEYTIEALVRNGISRLVIVTGYKSQVLRDFISQKFNAQNLGGMKIEYIENPVYDKTNNIYSLYLARNELTKDETLLLESDIIFKDSLITALVQSPEQNLAVVSPFEPWMDGTCTLLDEQHCITGMVDKAHFDWNETNRYFKTVNIYKFSPDFISQFYIPFLEAYQKAFGKNEYYEEVLKVLSFLSGKMLKALVVPGDDWYEIDDPADLAIAENRFSRGREKITRLQKRYGGYWRFPRLRDFCYLVNPYFPPQKLLSEMGANFRTLMTSYPSGANQQSILAAKIFNVPPEMLAVGNGAAELISSLSGFLHGKTGIPYPTFDEYPERLGAENVVRIATNPEDFSYDAQTILAAVKAENLKAVVLINPDNPTGNFLAKDEVLSLLDALNGTDVKLVFDESFIDFSEKEKRYSLIDEEILCKYPNLIVIKSISKSYGVPGLRLGFLASGDGQLVSAIKKKNSIWNINSFAEYFLQIFEKYGKTYVSACDQIVRERERFCAGLRKLPNLTVFPSQANFVLCRLEGTLTAAELTLELMEKYDIFIKDLSEKACFEDGTYIRLAVRDEADDNELISALKTIL